MIDMLITQPADAKFGYLLAHGAGAGMTSPFLNAITDLLIERGIAVFRFEFTYMTERKTKGLRRPPPKAETLQPEYLAALKQLTAMKKLPPHLFIGGKSMGGRVASMIAGEAFASGDVAGLICLGFPFHPPAKLENLRTRHLETLHCPTLIVQGERDPFGYRAEHERFKLDPAIEIAWIDDGDHDFGPRGASGFTRKGNLVTAANATVAFMKKTVSTSKT